jgi:DNA-binding transcriptional LysR family regulator
MTVLARELRERSPGVVVHAEQMLSVRVAGAVRSHSVGIGIARVPPGPGLATMVLAERERNLVAMPITHRWADRDFLSMGDLADETLIEPSSSVIGGEGSEIPLARRREADVSSEGELFDLVSSGLGILVTTEGFIRRNPRHDIITRPLEGSAGWSRDFLLWRIDDDSPTRRKVCEVAEQIRDEVARIAGP